MDESNIEQYDFAQKPQTLGARYISRLFDHYEVKQADRIKLLMEIFGGSYQTANRATKPNATWSVDDVAKVAQHYGESLIGLIRLADTDPGENATLQLNQSSSIHCRVWLGAEMSSVRNPSTELVGIKQGTSITVIPALQAIGQGFSIEKLVIEKRNRVAVLDDNRDSAKSVAEYLDRNGFYAESFTNVKDLRDRGDDYDAYVLDWLVDKEPILELIKEIRQRDARVCIVVITGEMGSPSVPALAVTNASVAYNFLFLLKPNNLLAISSTIRSQLAARDSAVT